MVTTRSKSRSQPTDLAPTDPAPAPTVPAKRGRSRRPARTITQSSSTTTLVAASATPAVDGSDTAPSSGTVTPGSKKVVFVVADDSDSDDGDSDFVNSGDSSDDFVSDHGESSAQRPRTRASDRAFVAAAEDQLDEAENERRALGDERRQLRRNETMAEMRLRDFDAELDIIRDQVDTAGAGEEEREQLREAAVEDRLEERDQLRQRYEEAAREHASREPELTQSIRSINQRIWDLRRGVPRARRLAPARPRGSRAKSRKRSKTKDEPELDIDAPPEGDLDHYHRPELFLHHPQLKAAWKSLPEPPEMQMTEQPPNLKIRLLPFQREGVWWMARQEGTQFRGGILADEMGMGKTLQTIGLMLVNRGKPTLVICPTVALLQWKSEIEAATDDLSVFLYYGADRKKLADDKGDLDPSELTKYDVVLTTYSVLETGFRRERYGYRRQGELRHEDSVLHKVDWHRIVLDEAHNIKDRTSNSARAAFELKTKYTWSLTGTPLHNRVGELYSLIRMTRCSPFAMYFSYKSDCTSLSWPFHKSKECSQCSGTYMSHICYWNVHVMNPIQKNPINSDKSRMAFAKLNKLLDNAMLRRTKVERAKDMGLPPRIVQTRRDKFSPEEEDFYVSLFSDYQREFTTYAEHGTVLNNYANIFELITRMRLAANHPDLLRLKVDTKNKTGCDSSDTFVCTICQEEAEDPIISKCKHIFCRVDAQHYVESADVGTKLRCPSCYQLFEIDLEQPEMTNAADQRSTADYGISLMDSMVSTPKTTVYRRSIVNRIDMNNWRSSTKIEALVEELSRHRQANTNTKSLVFSQFVNFLDLIQWRLNRAGFSVCRLDGRMTPVQRDAVIKTFMTRPEYTVFLVSLKAGGVALNLTEASHVYLADCWWNPAVEVQAMDRIHRMGQYRPIKVTRIIIENSIESRIIQLQKKKQWLADSTIGRDSKALEHLSSQDMQFLFSS